MDTLEGIRPWSDLPKELLELIASCLLIVDCIHFSAVCKNWCWINPAHPMPNPPWLLINSEDSMFIFIHPSCKKYKIHLCPELSNGEIHASDHGWLLCSSSTRDLFFFNPITKDKKNDLPSLPDKCFKVNFSSPPSSLDCKVFAFATLQPSNLEIYSCNLGDKDWVVRSFNFIEPHVPYCKPYVHGMFLYFSSGMGKIDVFDPTSSTWIVLNKPDGTFHEWDSDYVIEFKGEFFVFSIRFPSRTVHVFRIDPSKNALEVVTSLGDRTIYAGYKTALMVSTGVRGMENKIYIPQRRGSGELYEWGYYSMETRKYYLTGEPSLPKELFRDASRAKTERENTWAWIQPSYYRQLTKP